MNVTVIIPDKTWNERLDSLVKTIHNNYPHVQIICVLNTSSGVELNTRAKVLVKDAKLGEKRNYAAQNAETEFIYFLDSDAEIGEFIFEKALARFDSDPDIWIVGGPNLEHPKSIAEQHYSYLAYTSWLVGGPSAYQKLRTSSREVEFLPSCNLFMRKQHYLEMGGMNQQMITGEDHNLCHRVRQKDKKVYFDTDVFVFHYTRNRRGFIWQRFAWGYCLFIECRYGVFKKIYYKFFPFLFIILLFLLSLFGYFSLVLLILLIYFMSILVESIRISNTFQEYFKMPLYIFLGNIVPGVGSLFYLFNSKYPIYAKYDNKNKESK